MTIATERLVLRPLRRGDAGDLVRWLNNLNVARWTSSIPHPYGPDDARQFLGLCKAMGPGTARLAITRDSALIGVAGYDRIEDGAAAEIGYWLAEPLWGQGMGREAAQALVRHLFQSVGYDTLTARYRPGNSASRRILEGLGFRQTGTGTSPSRALGAEQAVILMRLPSSEWKGREDHA